MGHHRIASGRPFFESRLAPTGENIVPNGNISNKTLQRVLSPTK